MALDEHSCQNKKSGAGVKKFYERLIKNGELENHLIERNQKISNTLKVFWNNVDNDYINQREIKKQRSRDNWSKEKRKQISQKMSRAALKKSRKNR